MAADLAVVPEPMLFFSNKVTSASVILAQEVRSRGADDTAADNTNFLFHAVCLTLSDSSNFRLVIYLDEHFAAQFRKMLNLLDAISRPAGRRAL